MSRTLIAKDTSPTPMWRRNANGALFQIEEPDRNEYATPPRGTRARIELCGISETFEMESAQYGKSENVRLEFLIEQTSDRDTKWLEGKRFTQLFTWKVGPKSNLGLLLGALRGRAIEPGESIDPDAFIGTSFVTSTTLKENGDKQYAGVSVETIDPKKTRLSPYVTGNGTASKPEPEPELAGVAAGAGGDDLDNPFEDEADDL